MKIVDVGAVLLQPMPWVLVKVRTDEGITGIGEAYHGAGVHHIAVDERLTQRAHSSAKTRATSISSSAT